MNLSSLFSPLFALVLCLLTGSAAAQATFEVISLEGNAKVQRAQKKNWEILQRGMRIGDNDIIETYFKTKCMLDFGEGNLIILGSNSKALLNVSAQPAASGMRITASFTLFSGGIFAKAVNNCLVNIYTSNGVAEMERGALSTIVNAKSGETGFQVLGGSEIAVRNIAQQQGKNLSAGQTTMILPGREPTAPLYVTNKHVQVLKHFFGEREIDDELAANNIRPTDANTEGGRLRLSQNLMMGSSAKPQYDMGMYKKQFVLNDIYGKILDDEARNNATYARVTQLTPLYPENIGVVGLRNCFAFGNQGTYPLIELSSGLSLDRVKMGVRLKLAQNYANQFGLVNFGTGVSGILDMIDYVHVGSLSDYVHLGGVEDFSISDGLLVHRFSNRNTYAVVSAPALTSRFTIKDAGTVQAFIGDVSNFSYGGAHVLLEPSNAYLGAGYFYDANQYRPLGSPQQNRFVEAMDTVSDTRFGLHLLEFDLGTDLIFTQQIRVQMLLEYAVALSKAGQEGVVLRLPNVLVGWRNMEFGGGFTYESGRALMQHFSWFYPANRYRCIESGGVSSFYSQNHQLDPTRRAVGFEGRFGMTVMKGVGVEFEAKHDFSQTIRGYEYDTAVVQSLDSTATDILWLVTRKKIRDPIKENFSFYLAASVNEALFEYIKVGKVYLRQAHGGLYPQQGSQYMNSWGFAAGLYALSKPIVVSLAAELGCDFYFLDMGKQFNDAIDAGDSVFELYVGVKWGFM